MLSLHEPTWNKSLGHHTCCGSKHSYHYSSCPMRKNSIPGRSSDPDFMKIQDLKDAGFSSSEVAKQLGLPLAQVNDMWIL